MFEEVKAKLLEQPEAIEHILDTFGFDRIRRNHREIRKALKRRKRHYLSRAFHRTQCNLQRCYSGCERAYEEISGETNRGCRFPSLFHFFSPALHLRRNQTTGRRKF